MVPSTAVKLTIAIVFTLLIAMTEMRSYLSGDQERKDLLWLIVSWAIFITVCLYSIFGV